MRNVHTADDYFNLTLPADLMSAAATSPAWFGYIAALNVLGTPMLFFSTTTLAAKLLPGAGGDKKAIDKYHIFPKNYLTGISYSVLLDDTCGSGGFLAGTKTTAR